MQDIGLTKLYETEIRDYARKAFGMYYRWKNQHENCGRKIESKNDIIVSNRKKISLQKSYFRFDGMCRATHDGEVWISIADGIEELIKNRKHQNKDSSAKYLYFALDMLFKLQRKIIEFRYYYSIKKYYNNITTMAYVKVSPSNKFIDHRGLSYMMPIESTRDEIIDFLEQLNEKHKIGFVATPIIQTFEKPFKTFISDDNNHEKLIDIERLLFKRIILERKTHFLDGDIYYG